MTELIRNIIERFGGRPPASSNEKMAQQYLAAMLRKHTDNVSIQTFHDPVGSMFGGMQLICLSYYISLLLMPFSPLASLCVALPTAALYFTHFFRFGSTLNFLFPKKKSGNVIATLEPQKQPLAHIIVSGHIDSVYEYKWFRRLKNPAAYMLVLSGLLILSWPVAALLIALQPFLTQFITFPQQSVWISYLILSVSTLINFDMFGKKPVDGAIDNLSGVSLAFHILKSLLSKEQKSLSTLSHTRLTCISFGAEEAGLRGSKAFVKKNASQLQKTKTLLINFDSIKHLKYLTLLTGEFQSNVKYSKTYTKQYSEFLKQNSIDHKRELFLFGGTDGAPFAKAGIPAVSMIGVSGRSLDFTYHTKHDKLENLHPASLEKLMNTTVDFIKQFDSNLKK